MADALQPRSPARGAPPRVDPLEWEQQRHALEQRFAPTLAAAVAEVRRAEQAVSEADQALQRARDAAASERYRSDRRVFMRASLADEIESLQRKTTEKNLRAGQRFLVARAMELAEAEVAGHRDDQAAQTAERERGVHACEQARERAQESLDAAKALAERVRYAYDTAEQGLALVLARVADSDGE